MNHCLKCIEEFILDQQREDPKNDGMGPVMKFEDIKEAFTLVPTWQQTAVGNQMMMACVTVPTCFDHINYTPPTPAQQAAAGGRLLLPS